MYSFNQSSYFRKFIKSIGIGSFNYGMVQGVFTELEQVYLHFELVLNLNSKIRP